MLKKTNKIHSFIFFIMDFVHTIIIQISFTYLIFLYIIYNILFLTFFFSKKFKRKFVFYHGKQLFTTIYRDVNNINDVY